MQGHVTMSQSELSRLQILQRVIERRMTQAAAAHALGLSYRQVKRLMARFRRQGASGLVSGKRGKQGNRRLPAIYTGHVLDLVRGKAIQQPRARRQYFGELIQIDGSEHQWFGQLRPMKPSASNAFRARRSLEHRRLEYRMRVLALNIRW